MSIEEKITEYYNERIKKYKEIVKQVLLDFLGVDFKNLIAERLDDYKVAYKISSEGLEKVLANDGLADEEKELIEYLQAKIDKKEGTFGENNDTLILGSSGEILANEKNLLENHDFKDGIIIRSFKENKYITLCVIDIYNGSFDNDYSYIWGLIHHLLTTSVDNKVDDIVCLNFEKNSLGYKTYDRIINILGTFINLRLQKRGIFILDNKTLAKFSEDNIKEFCIKFFQYFGAIIPLYLLKPLEFANLVGTANFFSFSDFLVNNNFDIDIDEVLDNMYAEYQRNIKLEIVGINVPLIEKAMKQLRDKKPTPIPVVSQIHYIPDRNNDFKLFKYKNIQNIIPNKINKEQEIINNLNNYQEIIDKLDGDRGYLR